MAWKFLPPSLDLEVATLSLGLPARTKLRKSGIADIVTGGAADTTILKLTLGPRIFRVDFTPSLIVEVPAPLVNMGLGGVEYDLTTGEMSPRVWHEEGIGIPVGKDTVFTEACAFLRDLVTGTPLAIPPYDPAADPDLVLSVQQVLKNLAGDGGASVVQSVGVSARFAVNEELSRDMEAGGFRILPGAKITINVQLVGTPEEVQTSPRIQRVEVECTSLVLRSGGSDQAELGRIVLLPGCFIEVTTARPLGAPAKAAAMESLVRLFGALSTQGAAGLTPANLEARVVEGLVKKEIEDALRPALLQWVEENADLAAGIDLRRALGIPAEGDPARRSAILPNQS